MIAISGASAVVVVIAVNMAVTATTVMVIQQCNR